MTALPPVVSLLAALGANVAPPLPPGADFLAILTAAEQSVPEPAPEEAEPALPKGEEQKAPVEKPKKDGTAPPPSVPWAVTVPLPAPQATPPPPLTIELPFSPAPDVAPQQPVAAETIPPEKPALPTPGFDAMEPETAPPVVPAETDNPAGDSREPVEEPLNAKPHREAPAKPAREAPAQTTLPKRVVETAPAPNADVQLPKPEELPPEPAPAPAAPIPQPPADVVPPPLVDAAPVMGVQEPEAAPQQRAEVRVKTPLAFAARLVTASPKHADTKISAAAASAPAPEPQRRPAPKTETREEPKARAIRPAEDSEIVSDTPREARAANTALGRSVPAQDAPEQAEASPKTDAPKPAVRIAATPADPPKASPIAQDIRLEVAGADHKVELRVVERAGEVQVAVRTPDERLAGTLREHLPLLSSRLEQSGFRADQWRAADAGGAERRLDVGASAESSGRAPEHHGGNERQQQQEERRPQPAEERKKSQEKGTAFEWLMQSLR